MINIVASFSPDVLAADMLEKIKACWRDPFVPPTVVFTDSKTRQWFNLRMLESRGVSMNLNGVYLESFLFNKLKKTGAAQSLMTRDVLRDAIIRKLLSGAWLDKLKDADNIGEYLNVSAGADGIDYRHLFYLADDLAGLFMEYEISRDDIDAAIPGNDWQKDLYHEIMNDGVSCGGMRYYTVAELAEDNRKCNGGKIVFNAPDNKNVFVFGFSGIGQKYRDLLKELAVQYDVTVYLQASASDENKNVFLSRWGKAGNVNRRLFSAGAAPTVLPGAYDKNTALGKIQNAIANDFDMANVGDLNLDDKTLQVVGAPSKIREVEFVHSEICKLLRDESKNVTLKDILVVAPDIDEYKSEITAVFEQSDATDTDYPYVPFSIVDFSGKNSLILDALQTLYTILHDGGFARRTFFAFVKNRLVQNRYEINDDDVSDVFSQWMESMRVYRVRMSGDMDDWENATRRMLIAKLTDKTTCFSTGKVAPFSDFNTEDKDNDWLTKFVRIIHDVKTGWINAFRGKVMLSAADIDALRKFLGELFAFDGGLFKENLVWEKINHTLDRYVEYMGTDETLPAECVLLTLIDVASNVKFSTGAAFMRGVTFTSLLHNRILPAKYVFVMGMGSDKFPGVNKKLALDRRTPDVSIGDDDIPERNKNAFLCQLMAAGETLHISFVNKDLQTDNQLYPSCVLDTLTQYTGVKAVLRGIDETRDWGDLYTRRERRNKDVYMRLNGLRGAHGAGDIADKSDANPGPQDWPDMVSLTEFRYYAENPMKCFANKFFGYEEEDTSTKELEDIKINALGKSNLEKRLVKPVLDDVKPMMANYKDLLPDAPFDKKAFEDTKQDIEKNIDVFWEYIMDNFPDVDMVIRPNFPINVGLCCDGKAYTLRGSILLSAHNDTDIAVYTTDSASEVRKRLHELCALVAQVAKPGKEYTAHLVYRKPHTRLPESIIVRRMTKEIAESKLNEFYKRAFIECHREYLPFFKIDIGKISSFDDLRAKFSSEYERISYKKILSPDTDLGFSRENFMAEFKAAYAAHDALLTILSD